MKATKSYNVQIWVGLRVGYTDTVHSLDDVRSICDKWCNEIHQCVTITPTEYRYVGGSENGVVIGFINYPRFPSSEDMLINRATDLAKDLMIGLEQNRVSVVTPEKTYMLENK